MSRAGFFGGVLGLALLAGAPLAQGAVYAEIDDAGDLPAGAQTVGNGTTQITGHGYGPNNVDTDMFRFSWAGGALTIDTAGSSFDTILYLFSGTGLGIAGNDDAIGNKSQLVFGALPAGDYFVSVSTCCNQPQSAGGAIFPFVFVGGQYGPTGPGGGQPITAWDISTDPGTTPYQINFSAAVDGGATIPEPASLAMLGLGIAGFGFARARRRF